MNQVFKYGEEIALKYRHSQHEPASHKDPNSPFSIYQNMTYPERWVADYLQNSLDLHWQRETPVFVFDEENRPRVWTPEFYIPNLGVYIEVCGKESYNYNDRKKIYDKNHVNVIFLETYQHPQKWKTHLLTRLRDIERTRYNKTEDVFRNWQNEDVLKKLKIRTRTRMTDRRLVITF